MYLTTHASPFNNTDKKYIEVIQPFDPDFDVKVNINPEFRYDYQIEPNQKYWLIFEVTFTLPEALAQFGIETEITHRYHQPKAFRIKGYCSDVTKYVEGKAYDWYNEFMKNLYLDMLDSWKAAVYRKAKTKLDRAIRDNNEAYIRHIENAVKNRNNFREIAEINKHKQPIFNEYILSDNDLSAKEDALYKQMKEIQKQRKNLHINTVKESGIFDKVPAELFDHFQNLKFESGSLLFDVY
jgi:hypothetical protein